MDLLLRVESIIYYLISFRRLRSILIRIYLRDLLFLVRRYTSYRYYLPLKLIAIYDSISIIESLTPLRSEIDIYYLL